MALPMTASQSLAMLTKWGIPFKEYREWRTHNRNSKGPFSDINGLILHHTGGDGSDQRALLYDGLPELPGPLCQWGLDQHGVIHCVGWGRANHAGGGDPIVLQHVINEDYTGVLHPTKGNKTGVDGNAHFYGVEIWYSGSHEMTDAQYFTMTKLAAGICDFHKWTEKSVIAHGEWSSDKWDPGVSNNKIINMASVREDVKATYLRGPIPVYVPPVAKTAGYSETWDLDVAKPPAGMETDTNRTWAPMSILRKAAEDAHEARVNTEEILKLLKAK